MTELPIKVVHILPLLEDFSLVFLAENDENWKLQIREENYKKEVPVLAVLAILAG